MDSEKTLDDLIQSQEKNPLVLVMDIGEEKFDLFDCKLSKSPTPVTRPTTRGGVYFSDTHVYKLKASSNDLSLVPILSKTMLGPNQEFEEIMFETNFAKKDGLPAILYGNLTNSMQNSEKIEMNFTITRIG